MQHLGAMFFELGRTMMMLRTGLSPVCSSSLHVMLLCLGHHFEILLILQSQAIVNSGPAVYINSTGPNPIMVQVIIFTPFLLILMISAL